MARPALSTKVMTFTLLTAPASLALAALPSIAAAEASGHSDQTAGAPRHSSAPVRACSLKAADVRKGEHVQALGSGLRPRKTAQLWIEGSKVNSPQRIDKNGHVRMAFTVSQPPGRHPVWITDGVNRCDVPGGITVKK
ncbi:MAG: hypothetical protein JWO67_3509 [Streptosporangiaceae bacterium]|jgi:hypothetical protein|nr:hypothetical protein [Streptosporangiaceae bacterium]